MTVASNAFVRISPWTAQKLPLEVHDLQRDRDTAMAVLNQKGLICEISRKKLISTERLTSLVRRECEVLNVSQMVFPEFLCNSFLEDQKHAFLTRETLQVDLLLRLRCSNTYIIPACIMPFVFIHRRPAKNDHSSPSLFRRISQVFNNQAASTSPAPSPSPILKEPRLAKLRRTASTVFDRFGRRGSDFHPCSVIWFLWLTSQDFELPWTAHLSRIIAQSRLHPPLCLPIDPDVHASDYSVLPQAMSCDFHSRIANDLYASRDTTASSTGYRASKSNSCWRNRLMGKYLTDGDLHNLQPNLSASLVQLSLM